MKDKLINYIRAGFPALFIRTAEEARALEVVLSAAQDLKRNAYAWAATTGILQIHKGNDHAPYGKTGDGGVVPDTQMPMDAAKATTAAFGRSQGNTTHGLLVLCDLHTWIPGLDPITERQVKDVLWQASTKGATIIFLGPDFRIPQSWEKFVTVMDFELPNRQELDDILTKAERDSAANNIKLKALDNGEREDVLRAASGLTAPEAENAFALAVIEGRAEQKINPKTVYREKAAAVRRSGLMEIIEPDPRGLDAIGGLDNLKAWILQRKNAYSRKAQEYGLPTPRGIILAGVPGTGKSLAAKCVGTALNVPTIRLDIGCMMAGIVGESEARLRAALALAEAVAPCVLNLEEIEKALAGANSSGDLDSGIGRRLIGYLLTWLQERKREVFVFATANQIWHLPPELLRKGRWDEVWFLRLPKLRERKEIFRIHLEKRNRNPKKFNLDKLAEASAYFTGSECEEAIVSGMYAAFDKGKEVTTDHIVGACMATKPLSQTMSEDLQRIEKWGKERARPASSEEHTKGDDFRQMVGDLSKE